MAAPDSQVQIYIDMLSSFPTGSAKLILQADFDGSTNTGSKMYMDSVTNAFTIGFSGVNNSFDMFFDQYDNLSDILIETDLIINSPNWLREPGNLKGIRNIQTIDYLYNRVAFITFNPVVTRDEYVRHAFSVRNNHIYGLIESAYDNESHYDLIFIISYVAQNIIHRMGNLSTLPSDEFLLILKSIPEIGLIWPRIQKYRASTIFGGDPFSQNSYALSPDSLKILRDEIFDIHVISRIFSNNVPPSMS